MTKQLHNILVVEDHIEHQRLISDIFKTTEISVDFAASGEEAEQFIFSIQYSCVVIDLILPDTHGFDLLKLVKKSLPNLPVIVISAFGNERDTVDSIKLGAENYVSKSLGFEQRLHDVVINTLQQKQLLSKVSIAEERYKKLFNAANDMMFTLDLDGRFTSMNKRCYDYFDERELERLHGKSFNEIAFQISGLEKAQKVFHNVLYEQGEAAFHDFELKDKEGNDLTVEVSASVLKEKGKPTGVLCVARDVTKIVNLSNQQKQMQFHMMDRHRLATVGKMVQGVSHNLSTPLASIMGYAELLQMKYPEADQLQLIIDQCTTMNEIVRTMVNKGTKEHSDEKEYWDINKIIQDELKFFEANPIYKHQIKKTLSLSLHLPKIYVVYHHISQALDAFIQNSIDAMYNHEDPHLEINTYQKDEFIFMEIIDNGIGINDSDKAHIYEPFFTTKKTNSQTDEPTGVGLGLFQAYTLLEPYGITFRLETSENETKFCWKIPVSISNE
mgnify:CR=1 FL=1